jgi:hypothetical protein
MYTLVKVLYLFSSTNARCCRVNFWFRQFYCHRQAKILQQKGFLLLLERRPPVVQGLFIHEISRSHTTKHHIREDTSGRVISPTQRLLPDKTQHSEQTDFHDPGEIRTHTLSRRAAADSHLRPRGQRDRHKKVLDGEKGTLIYKYLGTFIFL